MAHLPQEIITEILVLLPVESLCRFKCVSKTWLSLISSPFFIKYHLQISSKTIKEDRNQKFILMFTKKAKRLPIITSFTCSLKPLMLDKCLKDVKTAKLGLDSDKFEFWPPSFTIVGSCNGVCCIQLHYSIILWNPSIRKSKHVRSLPNPSHFGFGDFGFAYDESTDDYRVVELTISRDGYDSGIIDYSLRKDSWKRIHDECDIMSPVVSNCCPFVGGNLRWVLSKECPFVGGNLHWLSEKCDESRIVLSYNLKTETLGEIMLPHNNEFVGNDWEPGTLGVLRGCLCMVLWFDYSIVIWMMKDYDVHESWSKVASYSGEQRLSWNPERLSWNELIWSSAGHEDDDDNNIMLSSLDGRLGLFRVKDGMMEEHHSLKYCSCFDEVEDEDFALFQATHHVESLVSPTY